MGFGVLFTQVASFTYVTFYYTGGCVGGELPGTLWGFGGWPVCVALVVLVQFLTIVITLAGCTDPAKEAGPVLEPLPEFR